MLLLRLRPHVLLHRLRYQLDQVLRQRENVLPVVIPTGHFARADPLQQVQQLQRLHDVLDGEGGHLRSMPRCAATFAMSIRLSICW